MKLSDHLQRVEMSPYVSKFPIAPFGFEGEGDAGDSGNGGDSGNADGANQGDKGPVDKVVDNTKGSATNNDDDDDDDDDLSKLTPAELRRRIKELDTSNKATKAEKKALEDAQEAATRKKRDDLTNAQADLVKEQELTATLRSTVESLALVNSILNTAEYAWHNVDVVLPLLDRSVVTIDDDGKVQNLKKELKRLATDHPYLLKSQQGNQGNQGGQQGNGHGRTGIQPGQGGAINGGQQQQLTETDLAKTGYTALLGRR